MTVNPLLNSVSAALAQQSQPVTVRAAASQATVSDSAQPVTDASVTTTSQPAAQSASLISASLGFAQLGSLLQSAQLGVGRTVTVLQQLDTLAQKASVPNNLTEIASEFQTLLSQLDQIGGGTSFGGSSLLDGTFSKASTEKATNNTATPSLSLPDLTVKGLFGSDTPQIDTPEDAQSALSAISQAQDTVSAASSSIEGVQSQLNFAAATVNSALANAGAAASTLNDSDLGNSDESDNFSALRNNPSLSAQTQTGNLSGSLLALLSE